MLDLQRHAAGTHFKVAGRFALRDFGIKRRPLRARLAALETEPDLLARSAAVAWFAVDRHPPGVDFLIAEFLRAGFHHLEVVVARQSRNIAGTGHAHLVFGLGIPRLHLDKREGPVEEICARHVAIYGSDLEFMFVEPQ